MNCDLMRQYIEFVADRLLVALQQSKVTTLPCYSILVPHVLLKLQYMCIKGSLVIIIIDNNIVLCRCTMLRIHLISWRTSPLKGKLTSLRKE